MKLVVGLGNPGPQYETTRHNVGFLAVDRLIERWSARGPQAGHQAEIYAAEVSGEKCLLVKPQTFMNLSGRSVGPLMQFYKLSPDDLIVLHDELDLEPFQMRLKTGGGTGGHNGLKSIDATLGAAGNLYHRIRIGVGHPRELGLPMSPADYVLGRYTDAELNQLDPLLDETAKAVEAIFSQGMRSAMNQFNRKKGE